MVDPCKFSNVIRISSFMCCCVGGLLMVGLKLKEGESAPRRWETSGEKFFLKSCRRVLKASELSNSESLLIFSKIMPAICLWTQENIFASTVFCNHEPTYAFCISLESTCHFLGSCLAITVRKELSNTAVPNTMEVHSAVLHDWNVRMFKHFQPQENTFGHVWNKASREQPREMFL